MNNGYLKAAACLPQLFAGGIYQNTQSIKKLIMDLNGQGVDIAVFPEMCLYGASKTSIASQNTLIKECEDALLEIAQFTKNRGVLSVIGLPLRVEEKILNCAAAVGMGKVWGIIYKSNIKFNFDQITLGDYTIPFAQQAVMRTDTDLPINIAIIIGKDLNSIFNSSANIILNPFSADLEQFDNYYEQIKSLSSSPPKAIVSVCGALNKTPYADKSCLIAECGKVLARKSNQPIATAEIDIERITGLRTLSDSCSTLSESSFIEIPIEETPRFAQKRRHPKMPYADEENFEHIYKRLAEILYELTLSKKRLAVYHKCEHFWTLFSLLLDSSELYPLKPANITLLADGLIEKKDLIDISGFGINIINLDLKSQNIKNAQLIDYAEKNKCVILGGTDRTDYIRNKPCLGHFVNPLINLNKTAVYAMLRHRRKNDSNWADILEKYRPSLDEIIIDFFIYHYIDCGLSAQKTKHLAFDTFENAKKIEELWEEFIVTI
ncbi:MAG TPA: hypothetical protein VIL24_02275 [Clostridia bacterium]